MPDNLARSQFWIGLIVRVVCGAIVGVVIGFGWLLLLSSDSDPTLNWGVFAAAVVLCALLSAKFGDTFWTRILPWLD